METKPLTERARFLASVQRGLDDAEAGRVIDDEELGRRLDTWFGPLPAARLDLGDEKGA